MDTTARDRRTITRDPGRDPARNLAEVGQAGPHGPRGPVSGLVDARRRQQRTGGALSGMAFWLTVRDGEGVLSERGTWEA
jgi:hypothetical protein